MRERKKDHSHVVFGLSTQYLSALLAAGAQYFASVLRAHPLAESMHFLAFADIRFESRSHLLHLPGEILIHMPIYTSIKYAKYACETSQLIEKRLFN